MCVYLVDYLDRNGLYSVLPSAYWQLQSTEAALFWVQNDILLTADSRGGAIRALSYYSDLTLSQEFQSVAAQLSMKGTLPLAKMLVVVRQGPCAPRSQWCTWHYWSCKTYRNTRYMFWQKEWSFEMLYLYDSKRPCQSVQKLFTFSRDKYVVRCSSWPSTGASTFQNLHNPS